jgi:hypothetical protein
MTEAEHKVYTHNKKLNRLPYKKIERALSQVVVNTKWQLDIKDLYRAVARWDIRTTQVMQEALEQVSVTTKRKIAQYR